MKYIAFIRGINVGGKNIVKMSLLQQEMIQIGFLEVQTYIQSGNVVFESSEKNIEKIEATIEKILLQAFGCSTKVMVRTRKELGEIIEHFPDIFTQDDWKHNVLFLSREVKAQAAIGDFQCKNEYEKIDFYNTVIYYSLKKETTVKTFYDTKLSGTKLYQMMTIRNDRTTRKLFELCK